MTRLSTIPAALLTLALSAQQISLDWATEVVPANNRVKTASDGSVFALGTGDDSAVIQHLSSSGTVLWTKTLSAPTLYAIDMDADGSDNIYIYVSFNTGQLDLDPGPNTTLVNPGKVYAKYNGSGQFQWGFSLENTTDASEDWGGISCDDLGNLYICGDLGEGVYDFDFGPGVTELEVFDFSTGSFMARYRPDGTLAWANVESWTSGFSNSKDIAAMRDGSSFYVVRSLDTGGPPSEQVDVDYGPGVYNVYIDSYHILRYDSALQFMAHGNSGYGDIRLCVDGGGSAYLMGQAQAGSGFWAVKYSQSGQTLDEVYSTALPVANNLRLGDLAPDEQGGCVGMYTNNGPGGLIRFYKMNVSGLVDFNLSITCGDDYTYPGGKGFDLDGSALYFGTYNQNHVVDYDPGPGIVSLPAVFTNDGVVARFDWCAGAPYDPFEIFTPGALCVGQPATFTVAAFGDASGYDWSVPVEWTITEGQGTETITVVAGAAGSGTVSVAAVNDCGTSAPIALDFDFGNVPFVDLGPDITVCEGETVILDATTPGAVYLWQDGSGNPTYNVVSPGNYSVEVLVNGCADTDETNVSFLPLPIVDLGPDQVICPGSSVVLNAAFPGAIYQWSPGGETSPTIEVSPTDTTIYSVTVTAGGCSSSDEVTIVVDPCLGINAPLAGGVNIWPVPVARDASFFVQGLTADQVLTIIGVDGRVRTVATRTYGEVRLVDVTGLAPGAYLLRTASGSVRPFVIAE